jgi:hypothetical protein
LAARLSGLFRICGFLCRFRAAGERPDQGRTAPSGFDWEVRPHGAEPAAFAPVSPE